MAKKIKDIYGTTIEVQNTASDYFRMDFTPNPNLKISDCVSLGYPETQELYLQMQKYLADRDLLPKAKKKKK